LICCGRRHKAVGAGGARSARVASPLRARGHFVELLHPEGGHTTIEVARFQLSRTPPAALGAAPTFGADAMWVLEEVLGYDGERIAELAIAGALE
jgi:crotonobetainyl-CoA:carnitine CoA-transferase CaiB-like acyl-CoA transferase